MKKITFNPEETVNISEIDNSSFCGVKWRDGDKTIVIQIAPNQYTGLGYDKNSVYGNWTGESVKAYLNKSLNQNFTECYVFDDFKSSLKWLCE